MKVKEILNTTSVERKAPAATVLTLAGKGGMS
jgi:hypothetical protein